MALVPCPECHKEVSTEARACPQCAFPYPGKHALEEERASGLHTCPQCHGLVSPDARTCPYCRVSLAGGLPQQEDNGESIQETLVCPHCRASYIHTRKVPKPVQPETTSPGKIPSVAPVKKVATKGSRTSHVEPLGKTTALLGPRRPSALWQDPSGSQKVPPPRYPRSKKNSILIGLILLVIVTISVVFGAIWQLNGLNPLETILSWRM
ncbi:MAG: zinc ribbon domain-containing protein [Nitrospira sp.]|nr:zinc ribbon domain-containing protein [Nitrospira sp.]MCA9455913.1 zinc ribbon domain-containing protein [Nitrospira sp.]HQU29665.1 zinc ribbon domain-containing protein [Nitrospirales bacterium]